MGIIGFLGFVCVLWGLYVLAKNTNESLEQQKQILIELKQLKLLVERVSEREPSPPKIYQVEDTRQPKDNGEDKAETECEVSLSKQLIDINQDDIVVLQTLPGVGKVLAQKIIDGRPYESMDALLKVQGISQDLLAKLQVSIKL
jgi:DNA uptake protein ComE-like DNA-binding protein